MGNYLEFSKARFLNVVNEYDVVPRAYGNKSEEGEMTKEQWPKAYAKLVEKSKRLELPWLDHSIKAKELIQVRGHRGRPNFGVRVPAMASRSRHVPCLANVAGF